MVHLQNLVDSLDADSEPPTRALVVNGASAASSAMSLGEVCTFPVLQDTAEAAVFELYEAKKDTAVVITPDGRIQARWPVLDLATAGPELLAAIEAAGE